MILDFFLPKKTKEKITYVYGYNTIKGIKNYAKCNMNILQELALAEKASDLSEHQILAACDLRIEHCNRIIDDCKQLLETTADPKVFFSRYKLLNENFVDMTGFDHFLLLKADNIYSVISYYEERKNDLEKRLIDRCYNKAQIKASSLKTEKGQKNQFIKAYNSFKEFEDVMDNESKFYLEKIFETYIH